MSNNSGLASTVTTTSTNTTKQSFHSSTNNSSNSNSNNNNNNNAASISATATANRMHSHYVMMPSASASPSPIGGSESSPTQSPPAPAAPSASAVAVADVQSSSSNTNTNNNNNHNNSNSNSSSSRKRRKERKDSSVLRPMRATLKKALAEVESIEMLLSSMYDRDDTDIFYQAQHHQQHQPQQQQSPLLSTHSRRHRNSGGSGQHSAASSSTPGPRPPQSSSPVPPPYPHNNNNNNNNNNSTVMPTGSSSSKIPLQAGDSAHNFIDLLQPHSSTTNSTANNNNNNNNNANNTNNSNNTNSSISNSNSNNHATTISRFLPSASVTVRSSADTPLLLDVKAPSSFVTTITTSGDGDSFPPANNCSDSNNPSVVAMVSVLPPNSNSNTSNNNVSAEDGNSNLKSVCPPDDMGSFPQPNTSVETIAEVRQLFTQQFCDAQKHRLGMLTATRLQSLLRATETLASYCDIDISSTSSYYRHPRQNLIDFFSSLKHTPATPAPQHSPADATALDSSLPHASGTNTSNHSIASRGATPEVSYKNIQAVGAKLCKVNKSTMTSPLLIPSSGAADDAVVGITSPHLPPRQAHVNHMHAHYLSSSSTSLYPATCTEEEEGGSRSAPSSVLPNTGSSIVNHSSHGRGSNNSNSNSNSNNSQKQSLCMPGRLTSSKETNTNTNTNSNNANSNKQGFASTVSTPLSLDYGGASGTAPAAPVAATAVAAAAASSRPPCSPRSSLSSSRPNSISVESAADGVLRLASSTYLLPPSLRHKSSTTHSKSSSATNNHNNHNSNHHNISNINASCSTSSSSLRSIPFHNTNNTTVQQQQQQQQQHCHGLVHNASTTPTSTATAASTSSHASPSAAGMRGETSMTDAATVQQQLSYSDYVADASAEDDNYNTHVTSSKRASQQSPGSSLSSASRSGTVAHSSPPPHSGNKGRRDADDDEGGYASEIQNTATSNNTNNANNSVSNKNINNNNNDNASNKEKLESSATSSRSRSSTAARSSSSMPQHTDNTSATDVKEANNVKENNDEAAAAAGSVGTSTSDVDDAAVAEEELGSTTNSGDDHSGTETSERSADLEEQEGSESSSGSRSQVDRNNSSSSSGSHRDSADESVQNDLPPRPVADDGSASSSSDGSSSSQRCDRQSPIAAAHTPADSSSCFDMEAAGSKRSVVSSSGSELKRLAIVHRNSTVDTTNTTTNTTTTSTNTAATTTANSISDTDRQRQSDIAVSSPSRADPLCLPSSSDSEAMLAKTIGATGAEGIVVDINSAVEHPGGLMVLMGAAMPGGAIGGSNNGTNSSGSSSRVPIVVAALHPDGACSSPSLSSHSLPSHVSLVGNKDVDAQDGDDSVGEDMHGGSTLTSDVLRVPLHPSPLAVVIPPSSSSTSTTIGTAGSHNVNVPGQRNRANSTPSIAMISSCGADTLASMAAAGSSQRSPNRCFRHNTGFHSTMTTINNNATTSNSSDRYLPWGSSRASVEGVYSCHALSQTGNSMSNIKNNSDSNQMHSASYQGSAEVSNTNGAASSSGNNHTSPLQSAAAFSSTAPTSNNSNNENLICHRIHNANATTTDNSITVQNLRDDPAAGRTQVTSRSEEWSRSSHFAETVTPAAVAAAVAAAGGVPRRKSSASPSDPNDLSIESLVRNASSAAAVDSPTTAAICDLVPLVDGTEAVRAVSTQAQAQVMEARQNTQTFRESGGEGGVASPLADHSHHLLQHTHRRNTNGGCGGGGCGGHQRRRRANAAVACDTKNLVDEEEGDGGSHHSGQQSEERAGANSSSNSAQRIILILPPHSSANSSNRNSNNNYYTSKRVSDAPLNSSSSSSRVYSNNNENSNNNATVSASTATIGASNEQHSVVENRPQSAPVGVASGGTPHILPPSPTSSAAPTTAAATTYAASGRHPPSHTRQQASVYFGSSSSSHHHHHYPSFRSATLPYHYPPAPVLFGMSDPNGSYASATNSFYRRPAAAAATAAMDYDAAAMGVDMFAARRNRFGGIRSDYYYRLGSATSAHHQHQHAVHSRMAHQQALGTLRRGGAQPLADALYYYDDIRPTDALTLGMSARREAQYRLRISAWDRPDEDDI